ncbi:MAG: hypothetical protein MI725_09700, partial [Pirellulales bacterium]|nr:hypothetical protein [Pirellulales bacterium]
MMRVERRIFVKLWAWCAASVPLSVLVGLWHAQSPTTEVEVAATSAETDSTPETFARQVDYEQIESTLAQAGCPGWMVLASEGEAALVPPDVKEVAQRVPIVKYPGPLRVAQRERLFSESSKEAILSAAPKDDPDDLLDGVPDLLAKPPADEAAPTSEETPPPAEEQAPAAEVQQPATAGDQAEIPEFLPPVNRPKSMPRQESTPQPTSSPVPPSTSPFAPPPVPSTQAPHATPPASTQREKTYCEFVADSQYPTAEACSKCHEQIYDEWRGSSHAYAMISPMFH